MNRFRTVVSVNDALGGAVLFSLIAGFACVIYTLDNREK